MTGRLKWLLLLMVVFLAGYFAVNMALPEYRLAMPSLSDIVGGDDGGSSGVETRERNFETVTCELIIPSAADCGSLEGCPAKKIEHILGVSFANPHGLCIATVEPDGPAAKGGVEPGDQLGHPTECPAGVLTKFFPGAEERTLTLDIRRPRRRAADTPAQEEPEASAQQEAIEPTAEEETESPS